MNPMVVMPAWMRILIASALCFGAGGIAALYVPASTPAWFASLPKPSIFSIEPGTLFFVCIVLYALLAIASSLMWIHDPRPWDFRGWVPLFFTHLLVNMAWMILFFGYHDVFLGMIVSFLLAIYVALLYFGAYERNRTAFLAMTPYFLFALYAMMLNVAVWMA